MKIAIVKLSALGDIIHAMIILQFIKKYNPVIQIDWIVEECYKGLLEYNPHVNKIHSVNFKKVKKEKSLYRLFGELRKVRNFGQYDLVIDLQGLFKSAVISRLISSPITIGFDRSSIRENIASILYNKTFNYGYDANVIERNIAIIEFALGFKVSKQQVVNMLPFLYPRHKPKKNIISHIKKNIILVPGASHKSKCYPVEKFAKFATNIDANFLIIWGSQEEKIMANKIQELAPKVTICEKLSLDALISLISQVSLLIGSDTGPTHIGWALNIPSITLFGSTPGYRNSYITKINRIIESSSQVNPFKLDRNDMSIESIEVQEILLISKNLLNQE